LFTYWTGYEVDGSSTTYNIVVPERRLVEEVIRYFLSLKVIDRSASIALTYSESKGKDYIVNRKSNNHINENFNYKDLDKLCEVLVRPQLGYLLINTECARPDKLHNKVLSELYSLSKTRPGAEGREYNYKNPSTSPLYYGADLGVSLEIDFPEVDEPAEEYEAEGLIFNKEALASNLKKPYFRLSFNCGPSFIYEYAAYIVSKIAERFPEVGIDGGIDCAGGFVDGCTYSCSLYAFEKITLTATNIAGAIHSIFRDRYVVPQRRSGRYGYDNKPCKGLFLFNLYDIDKLERDNISAELKIIKGMLGGKKEFTPEEYEALVTKAANVDVIDSIDFLHYFTCCVSIGGSLCAMTAVKEKNQVWLQFRVVPELREEFVKRLKRMGHDVR
jgi:hypothetical protein